MRKLKMFRVSIFELRVLPIRVLASLRSNLAICVLVLATCHLPLATCEAATNLYLNVTDSEFVRRVAAITNNEAKITLLNTASNALNTVVTGLVVTVSNLSTSGGASIPVLSNRVDQVEDDLAASIGNYSNSYLKVSGTWKGGGFNYYYAGMTNSRPIYQLVLSGSIWDDTVYFNGTNWVAVQSTSGTLFYDYSDPISPHHYSTKTNSIPPQVFVRNTTNEYGSGTLYVRFISSAEATLEQEIYREAWNQISALVTNSTINGEPFVTFGSDGRPVFYTTDTENGYHYSNGYWSGREGSELTRVMTSLSWLPPRIAKAAMYDSSSITVTNVWLPGQPVVVYTNWAEAPYNSFYTDGPAYEPNEPVFYKIED